ncbi:MAG TPA: hypothetical protein DEF30_08370 [Proteiniclasticum sp.]|uniref:hypothetical protein n=1 Tax=Proteiniclasticum sp. TaxID=2053595 RepID=UPI000E8A9B55|nr:hypothetical protein [Proteiniclasticum sp.]HBW13815.1 hypothetical protein [Proteiniclasticum sp.]
MWIRSQNGDQVLKVERFRSIKVNEKDTNILAKLERETVILGTYCHEQAELVMSVLWCEASNSLHQKEYAMPVRWEDEEEEEE